MLDEDTLRKLDEVARRVDMYRRAWHAATPEQANQAYERYRAEEEYLAMLLDKLLGGEFASVNYPGGEVIR